MKQFKLSNDKKKALLAGYYNMARYNLFKTLYHIMHVSGVRVGRNFTEDNIDRILVALYKSLANETMSENERALANSVGLRDTYHEKVRTMLFKHFPILAPTVDNLKAKDIKAHEQEAREHNTHLDEYSIMKGATLVDCLKILSNLATCITDIRNKYTHFNPFNTADDLKEQYKRQAIVARYLDVTIVASRRKVKERDNMDAKQFDFLTSATPQPTDTTHFELVKENRYIQRLSQLPDYKREPWMEDYIENRPIELTNKYRKYTREFARENTRRRNEEPLSFERWMPGVSVEREDYYFNTKTWVEFGGNNGEVNHSKALSDFGLVYLCCLFLSKNYAKQLIDESDLLKATSIGNNFFPFNRRNNNMNIMQRNRHIDNVRCVMPNIMIYYCIRNPKGRRLETDDTNIQLAMDMLNELRRCPKELYELLSQEDREEFADVISAPTNRTDEQGRTIYEPTGERFMRLRYSDRFAELALRYIDQKLILPTIRFQVRLGKYRFNFYDKTTIDGQRRLRIIQKDINGYGCLNEIDKRRKVIWNGLIKHGEIRTVGENELEQLSEDTPDTAPYVTDARATYNIAGNRIGLYWNNNGENVLSGNGRESMYIPTLSPDRDNRAIVNQPAPLVTLSTRELPALVFYEYLRNSDVFRALPRERRNEFPIAEAIIKAQYANTANLFQGIADGSITTLEQALQCGIKVTDIPEKLREYLGDKERTDSIERLYNNTVIEDGLLDARYKRLSKRLKTFIANREVVGTKDNKFAKKSHVDVRPGSLARYLGPSIMDWLPSDSEGRRKLTGLNYSVMMSVLAGFGSTYHINDLEALFIDAKIVAQPTGNHPFLSEVLNRSPRNIEEFYDIYIRKEETHLDNILNSEDYDDNNLRDYLQEKTPFVHPNRKRWNDRDGEYYRGVAARYLNVDGKRATIQLPDGLFTQAILDILQAMYPQNTSFANNVNNVSYLISQYLDTVMNEQSQDFYCMDGIRYKRGYKFFTVLRNEFEVAYDNQGMQHQTNRLRVQYKSPQEILEIFKENSNRRDGEDHFINISLSIPDRAAHLTDEEEANYRSKHRGENFQELMVKKLRHLLSECRNTERTLRRYRIQDIVTFLMAKNLVRDTLDLNPNNTKWRLENVTSNDFLNQTVTFRQPIDIDSSTRVYIVQENVSIKNYNMAFRYMKDERLESLLPQLIRMGVRGLNLISATEDGHRVYELPYSLLYNELGCYDRNRTNVFSLIHGIESQALDTVEGINDENSPNFYFAIGDAQIPVRNNFNEMIRRLVTINGRALTTDEKSVATSIRNAFGHNHYPNRRTTHNEAAETEDANRIRSMNMEDILNGQNVTLPMVAESIKQKLENVRGNDDNPQS